MSSNTSKQLNFVYRSVVKKKKNVEGTRYFALIPRCSKNGYFLDPCVRHNSSQEAEKKRKKKSSISVVLEFQLEKENIEHCSKITSRYFFFLTQYP